MQLEYTSQIYGKGLCWNKHDLHILKSRRPENKKQQPLRSKSIVWKIKLRNIPKTKQKAEKEKDKRIYTNKWGEGRR